MSEKEAGPKENRRDGGVECCLLDRRRKREEERRMKRTMRSDVAGVRPRDRSRTEGSERGKEKETMVVRGMSVKQNRERG